MLTKTDPKFAKIFNPMTSLPTLSEVANKLLQLSEKGASPARFAATIETDPGITAKVLKLVNSAFYSLKNPVANLTHACSLIGTRTIKSLALSVSVMQVFKRGCEGFDQVRFWKNSLATAMISRKLAEKVYPGGSAAIEELYMAGLLHAAGVPLFVQFFPDDYATVLEEWRGSEDSLLELEERKFGATHPEAGSQITTHWRFPQRVATVIRFHRVSQENVPQALDEDVARMIEVVRLADFWTRRSGVPFIETDAIDADVSPIIPDWFGLDETLLGEFIGDVGEMLSGMESVFKKA